MCIVNHLLRHCCVLRVSKEQGMTKDVRKKDWAKPEVKPLGKLKDVSGGAPSNLQGNFT